MSRPQRIVVVGNGIAGVTAADALRTAGHDGELTIVGDEQHAAYSRPALSKALLNTVHDMTSHELPPATHEAIEVLGRRATALDIDSRLVVLDDGERLPYDGLVVASGCRARRLGAPDSKEITLRTIDDALMLRGRLAGRPSVVVVGGGPLGMEIASGCLSMGCEVTLVSQGRPLVPQLGTYLAGIFVSAAEALGLRLVVTELATVHRHDDRTRVVLSDGTHLDAELVVTAAGDLPNIEWLRSSDLLTDGALVVDSRGRVRPEIVAAGDVAMLPTRRGLRRVPLWTSAIDQGKTAAAALLHGDDALPLELRQYFWTEQFGLALKAAGELPVEGEPTWLDGDRDTGSALLRWEHGDGLAAAAAINYRIPVPRLRRLCEVAA